MKVVVIVPVYNAQDYIDRVVSSVFTNDIEVSIIFIDDCSSDNSYEKLMEYQRTNMKVLVFKNSENRGVSYSRNVGLSKVKQDVDYVFFLDSDDWLESNILDKLVAVAEKNNSDIVMGQLETFNGKKYYPHIYNKWFFHTVRFINTIEEFPELLLCPTLSNKLIKFSLIQKLKLSFVEKRYYAEDFHFSLRLLLNSKGISVTTNKVVIFQNLGNENTTTSLWNTSSSERAWNTLLSVKDMHAYLSSDKYEKYKQMILYHSIYRFPRNISYMVGKKQCYEYFSEIRAWLESEGIIDIPCGFVSKAIKKQASIKSYLLMKLIFIGKFDEAIELLENKTKIRKALLSIVYKSSPVLWENGVVKTLPRFSNLFSTEKMDSINVSLRDRVKQLVFIGLISNSGLFDKDYYKKNNNSYFAKLFPLLHYLFLGSFEGKDPSTNFSTNGYYHFRPDVKDAKLNALGHFVKYGVFEI